MISIDISAPPPTMVDHSLAGQPPSNLSAAGPQGNRFNHSNHYRSRPPFRPQHNNQLLNSLPDDFDGKRLRKSNMRKTVDYNTAVTRMIQNRVWQRDYRDRHALQPDVLYIPDMLPPSAYKENPINSVTTRFVKTATNKMRCPIFCMAWTPEGRRLVTGASSGEFTLWNGLTFNFETILQAHDSPVRSMVWNHSDSWMMTGDHAGYCKYWQSNMNNVRMFQAHKEAIRGLSFCPTDQKIVSCSDDGTLRIWDFQTCQEERVLRGHGADVKCCSWHPHMGLIASGSKDNQQPIKLWDPKSGNSLTTLHAHKATVMDLKWNRNGNWFITASRDHFLKLFDLRNLAQPVQTFRGHKKEASCLAWHPHHEGLLASGGSDGAILFWHVGADKEVGSIDSAHDSIVWTLDWHPLGHILASGSNDHTTKFWTRNRPGDKMRDKYNLNLGHANSVNDDGDLHEEAIPGMAPEDRVEMSSVTEAGQFTFSSNEARIPGLEETEASARKAAEQKQQQSKKQAYSKPIPKNFVASWNESHAAAEILNDSFIDEDEEYEGYGTDSVLDPISLICNKIIEAQPGVKKVEELEPDGVIAYGRIIPIKQGSKLYRKVRRGNDSLQAYLTSGKVKQLKDLPGFWELEQIYESNSDSSSDDEGYGRYPTKDELAVEKHNMEEYLKPFTGFVEADLDDVPYRDKEGRDLPRGFGREEEERERINNDDFRNRREDWGPGGRGQWDNNDRDGPPGFMGPGPWAQGPQMNNFMGPRPMGPNMMNPFMMMNMGPNFGPGGPMGGFQGNMMGGPGGPNGNNFDRGSRNMNDRDTDMEVERNRWENRKRNFNDESNNEDSEWRRNDWDNRERGNNFRDQSQGGWTRRGRGGRPPRRGGRGGRFMN